MKKNTAFIKAISFSVLLCAAITGCSKEDIKEFFDVTPAMRTPPLNADITPTDSQAQNEEKTTSVLDYLLTQQQPEETEPQNSLFENQYQKPDTTKLEQYPNMWCEQYIGKYKKAEKTVYLTFDDGPSQNTDAILKVLKDNDIKATFFIVPDEGEVCAKRLRAITAAGHTIGVHSFTHNYLTVYADEKAYVKDFAKAYDIIVKATNKKPWLYRFPGGSVNQYNRYCREGIKKALSERGFVYYDWNVDSNDWRGLSSEQICQNVTADAKKFSSPTILMHDTDTRDNTVAALENVIKCLKDGGYKFAPLTPEVEPVQYGVNF